jgi:hypothetical protein
MRECRSKKKQLGKEKAREKTRASKNYKKKS